MLKSHINNINKNVTKTVSKWRKNIVEQTVMAWDTLEILCAAKMCCFGGQNHTFVQTGKREGDTKPRFTSCSFPGGTNKPPFLSAISLKIQSKMYIQINSFGFLYDIGTFAYLNLVTTSVSVCYR